MNPTLLKAAQILLHLMQIFAVMGIVSYVLVSSLCIVICLHFFGGKISAEVIAKIKKSAGNSLVLHAAGYLGAYLAVVITECVVIYFVASIMPKMPSLL